MSLGVLRRSAGGVVPALIRAILLLALVVVMGALVFRYVSYTADLLRYPYDWDEDEGQSIYFAKRIADRLPIYVDFNKLPMLSACYPPVYHAVVSLLVRAFGPTLLAGRLVSLAATAGLCAMIVVIVRQETRRWDLAGLAAAMVLGSPAVTAFAPLARVDALAICAALGGLLLVRQYPRRRIALIAGLLLMVCACYTKYQMVFLAPAAFWHIWRRNRPAAVVSATAFAAAGIAVLIYLMHASSGHFLQSTVTVQTSRFALGALAGHTRMFLEQHALLAAGAMGWIVYRLAGRDLDLWAAAALASVPVLVLAGKTGATINYFIPSIVAAAICTVLAIDRLQKNLPLAWSGSAACLLILLLTAQGLVWGLRTLPRPTDADRRAGDRILEAVRATQGDVLTERCIMFSLLAGREPQVDACTLGLAYRSWRKVVASPAGGSPASGIRDGAGARWDPAQLIQAIEQRRYPFIVLERRYFPLEVLKAIESNYKPIGEPVTLGFWHGPGRYLLLVPR